MVCRTVNDEDITKSFFSCIIKFFATLMKLASTKVKSFFSIESIIIILVIPILHISMNMHNFFPKVSSFEKKILDLLKCL